MPRPRWPSSKCTGRATTGTTIRPWLTTSTKSRRRTPTKSPSNCSAAADPPEPLGRPRIQKRLALGVRALDAFVPCGQGQRLGIFAGSGVGKSSLLGMIARSTEADVNVIALVGERGREVREFVERDLGGALSRSVVVVATSDQPALVRIKAGLRGDRDRRALPRPGRRRDADDGLGDALRDGPARGRPGDRRAARDPRLHPERLRHAAAAARARRAPAPRDRSPASTRCWSTATT